MQRDSGRRYSKYSLTWTGPPDVVGCVEALDMTDELESALSQATEVPEEETKKSKKSKKKKNNTEAAAAAAADSSADDFKEVEVKPKKKKNKKQEKQEEKEKTPEPQPIFKEKTPEVVHEKELTPEPMPRSSKKFEHEQPKEEQMCDSFKGFEEEKFEDFEEKKNASDFEPVESPTVEENATDMFEEFSKKTPPSKEMHSPDRDLVEFSEEESSRMVEIDEDNDDSEKVEFFIKEKSSSVEPDEPLCSNEIDPMAARPNPWFEKFMKKSCSIIEDQIFGAAKKYEDDNDKGSDDEGMQELEKNQADTEKNIADLLEDDDDQIEPAAEPKSVVHQISSNLSQLLKGESTKKALVDDSSDDDFMLRYESQFFLGVLLFPNRPVPQQKKNKKQKKQKGQVLSLEEFHRYSN